MPGHFAWFGGFFGQEVLLKQIAAVLGGLCNTDGRPVCDYALIAAMSGWTPMMFMTRVRL